MTRYTATVKMMEGQTYHNLITQHYC